MRDLARPGILKCNQVEHGQCHRGLPLRSPKASTTSGRDLRIGAYGIFLAPTSFGVVTAARASAIRIAGIYVQPYDLLIIGLAAVAATGVWLLLSRTRTGAAMQAVAADYEAATAVGINAGRSNAMAFPGSSNSTARWQVS